MGINLLADEPEGINLLADDVSPEPMAAPKSKSFYELSKEDQGKAMDLARKQISQQYPNMPVWLRDMMLSITPKDESPRLKKTADFLHEATNSIPVAAGGLMEGFAMPFQGVASMIPGKVAEDFAKEDFTRFLPGPENEDEKSLQTVAELGGSLGPLGKLFGALKGGAAAARVPKALQNASALTGTGIIATPGDSTDKGLGAVGALALGAGGKLASKTASAVGTKVPAFLRGLTNESTEQSLIDAVQKPHDVLGRTADQLYNYVRDSIKKRNVSIPVKQEYLDAAKAVLPKTRASQQLIDKVRTGDYDAVHDLQSHLYKKGTKGMASDDIAIENQGEEIMDLRNKINDDLKNNLIQNGHADIAHVLEQGRGIHKQLMDTYFNKNLPKGIGNLVRKSTRAVPKDLTGLFEKDSVSMKKFLQAHPEVTKHVKGIKEKEAAKQALKKILWGSGGAAVGITGTKTLYDLLK